MRGGPYLTKSSYVRGVQCARMLWLSWHQRLPYEAPAAGSPAAVGTEIGTFAHQLFPGGVLVDAAPFEHAEALARTRALMADLTVPAIFEAAFEHGGVRIRADVMERLADGRWGLREVKSATKVKATAIDDAAVQAYVLEQSGVALGSIELVHVDTSYQYDGGEIDWRRYFKRVDIGPQVAAQMGEISGRVRGQLMTLHQGEEPAIAPSPHCPAGCDYWEHCTAQKPKDWIFQLPRLSQKKFDELTRLRIERISDIPARFELTDAQERMRDVIVSGRPYVSGNLGAALRPLEGAVAYLDFEAMNPAVPVYVGTKPYQRIAFQWSLHEDDGRGTLTHADFLGDAARDPREAFVASLIDALDGKGQPIIVYSAYERGVLAELGAEFPAYKGALEGIIERLADLYVVVRDHVYLEAFGGSFSIKKVGRALAPGFSYEGLEHVADGAQAAIAYQRLASGRVEAEEAHALRAALIAYCRLDTLAMVEAHRGLKVLAMREAA